MTVTKSISILTRSNVSFKWPQQKTVLEQIVPAGLDTEVELWLKDCGILRKITEERKETKNLAGAARTSGRRMDRNQVKISFDTFLARSRPGLGSEENLSKTAKKNRRNRNNRKKMAEDPVPADKEGEDVENDEESVDVPIDFVQRIIKNPEEEVLGVHRFDETGQQGLDLPEEPQSSDGKIADVSDSECGSSNVVTSERCLGSEKKPSKKARKNRRNRINRKMKAEGSAPTDRDKTLHPDSDSDWRSSLVNLAAAEPGSCLQRAA